MSKYTEVILAAVTKASTASDGGAGVSGDEKGTSQHRFGHRI